MPSASTTRNLYRCLTLSGWCDHRANKTHQCRRTLLQYNSVFSTNCGVDFELHRGGRPRKRILEMKTWAGSWNYHPVCSKERDLGTSQFWKVWLFCKLEKLNNDKKICPLSQEGRKNCLAQMQDSQKQWQKSKGKAMFNNIFQGELSCCIRLVNKKLIFWSPWFFVFLTSGSC